MPRPERIDCALFDFDGTLADTEVLGLQIDLRVMPEKFGFTPTWEELCTTIGTNGETTFPPIFARRGIEMTVDEYWDIRGGNQEVYFSAPLEPFPGVRTLLESLRERGVRMGIVSTTNRPCIEGALERLDLARYFDATVCGEEPPACKPAPDPYLMGMELLGANPARTVVFEDSPSGVAAGKAAGAYVIAFKGGVVELDTALADEEIRSYEGLTL
ncbi:MAG: HAD family hydrolase [Olsenella sp.]|nr:HAD family hydrolase [Olsenella sp.]